MMVLKFDGTVKAEGVMKHAELRSIVHNVADSLASGIGLMIGVYNSDTFGEAARSPSGLITVDFLLARWLTARFLRRWLTSSHCTMEP
jgi:hypothetical protein